MTQKEMGLAATLLNLAFDLHSNHSCNEVEAKWFKDFTPAERDALMQEYKTWNGDENDDRTDILYIGDHELMDFMAYKLRNSPK